MGLAGASPLTVGGLSRQDLAARLQEHGVGLNAHAETLLAHSAFDTRPPSASGSSRALCTSWA